MKYINLKSIDYKYLKVNSKFKLLDTLFLRYLIMYLFMIAASLSISIYFNFSNNENYRLNMMSYSSTVIIIILFISFIKSLRFDKIKSNFLITENRNLIEEFFNKKGIKYNINKDVYEVNIFSCIEPNLPNQTLLIFPSDYFININSIRNSVFAQNKLVNRTNYNIFINEVCDFIKNHSNAN